MSARVAVSPTLKGVSPTAGMLGHLKTEKPAYTL